MRDQDLSDVYEMLEEMTPPEVRLARRLLGEMHGHEERLLELEETLLKVLAKTERVKVMQGALEETINNVRTIEGRLKAILPDARIEALEADLAEVNAFLDAKYKTEGRAEQKAKRQRSEAKERRAKERGKYCLQCHKLLNPAAPRQRIFCSTRHSHDWRVAHPGEEPYPLTKLRGGFEASITPGQGVESDAYKPGDEIATQSGVKMTVEESAA